MTTFVKIVLGGYVEALFGAHFLELVKSRLLLLSQMADVTSEPGLRFGSIGRRRALVVFETVAHCACIAIIVTWALLLGRKFVCPQKFSTVR